MKRLGILISGRGSNFEAIADSVAAGRIDAAIGGGDLEPPGGARAGRGARARAERRVYSLEGSGPRGLRPPAGRGTETELGGSGLPGRIHALLSAGFIREFPLRILNIHPSLLPAFPGLDAQHQALEHGVKVGGCTVHFGDECLDSGPILVQTAVPVLNDDTVEALSARILKEEHRIYTEAINLVLAGNFRIEGRRVVFT